jgi:hypothetical protein
MTVPYLASARIDTTRVDELNRELSALSIQLQSESNFVRRATLRALILSKQESLNKLSPDSGAGVAPRPAPAPVFSSARIDVGRVGVGDLKILP